MKNFLSMQEFSKLSGVEISTLRYWDSIGLFSPIKRNPENNYRRYSPEQIMAVKFITVMSELGVSLKTIGEIEKERNPEKIIRLIEQQEKLLDMKMMRLRECYSIIHMRRELINYGMKVVDGFTAVDGVRMDSSYAAEDGIKVNAEKISVLKRDDLPIIIGPRNEWKEGEGFYGPFKNFCAQAEKLRINLSFPIGGMHENWQSFLEAPSEPDYFFSLDPTGSSRRKAGEYLIGFSRNYYGRLDDAAKRLAAYAEEHSLTLHGPVYVMYLHDEVCIQDHANYLAQVCVAVSKHTKKGRKV